MAKLDASCARCIVLTYKEGLLSAVAHDLKIEVTRFTLEVDDAMTSVAAVFEASSLRVVCAVRDGIDAPATLSEKDKRDIEGNIAKDVLDVRKHPQIRFNSTKVEREGEGFRVKGRLEIKGKTRELSFVVRSIGPDWVCEVKLHQPDFGIKSFSAMLGAMKIKPDVDVRLSVPKSRVG